MTSVGSSTSATPNTTTPPTTTTPSLTQTTNGAGSQSIGGLATGLDTNAIIAALVAAQRSHEDTYTAQVQLDQIRIQSYNLIQQDLSSLTTAALALNSASDWRALTATSSNTNIATVTAGNGNFGGTLQFFVNNLAAAGSVRSANTIASTTTAITSTANIFVAAGGKNLGLSTLASDNALTTGAHTITVTQASSAAIKSNGSALAGSTLVDGTNDTLNVTVNGAAKVLTLAHGTYTAAQLAQAVQDAATSAGAAISATALGSGVLQLATTREGSQATLQVTGGNSLTALGLTVDGSALTGSDGALNVDGGNTQTFNSIDVGQSLVLNAAVGTITAVAAGGLRTGAVTGSNVSTGDGSLGTVVANINAVNAGVTATAVQVGANSYRLQLTSNTAGALNGENVDGSVFNANVGGLVNLTTAADANITVGSGLGAYTVTSATNTVSGLLPGVTVNLVSQDPNTAVTITVGHDDDAIAKKVQALVDAANQMRSTVAGLTQYDPTTQQASPLTGDSSAETVLQSVTTAFISAVSNATPQSPGLAGVSIDKDGNFTFDKAKFTAAFDANPQGIINLFVQGGTATNGSVQFVSAGDRAVSGTYAINVTQAATQASATGLTGAWPPGAFPTITVSVNGKNVSYTVKNTDSRADVAAALNSAFAGAKFALQATDTGAGVQIQSQNYGSAAAYSVDWGDGAGSQAVAGLDVQGTINGVSATGSGQQLFVPFTDNQIPGLAVFVKTTQTGDLGTVTYAPGIAARVQTAITQANDPVTGFIPTAIKGLNDMISTTKDTITSMEERITQYETMLRQQYATLESTIGNLKSQSNWLAGQVASLTGNK